MLKTTSQLTFFFTNALFEAFVRITYLSWNAFTTRIRYIQCVQYSIVLSDTKYNLQYFIH